jgi:non-homologous end joining protein Ku
MRAIWKGSIAFGLVHIPVNLYPAIPADAILGRIKARRASRKKQ